VTTRYALLGFLALSGTTQPATADPHTIQQPQGGWVLYYSPGDRRGSALTIVQLIPREKPHRIIRWTTTVREIPNVVQRTDVQFNPTIRIGGWRYVDATGTAHTLTTHPGMVVIWRGPEAVPQLRSTENHLIPKENIPSASGTLYYPVDTQDLPDLRYGIITVTRGKCFIFLSKIKPTVLHKGSEDFLDITSQSKYVFFPENERRIPRDWSSLKSPKGIVHVRISEEHTEFLVEDFSLMQETPSLPLQTPFQDPNAGLMRYNTEATY